MTLKDWTQCDFCLFPARYSFFKEYIKGNDCPMCTHKIVASDIKLIPEERVMEILKGKLESIEHTEDVAPEEMSVGMKRSSIKISDESNLPLMPPATSDSYINGYDQGGNILPPGVISGSGGMAI